MQRRGDVDGINAGSIVAGRYRIVARLGGGEEGSVWKAADLRAGGEACAVKVQHRAIDASHARLLLSLDHPHLARTRNLGSLPGGGSFAVMDLGWKGSPWMPSARPRPWCELGSAWRAALEALSAVGIVHGDVKPSNILVRGDRAVLVDLGAAIAVGSAAPGCGGAWPSRHRRPSSGRLRPRATSTRWASRWRWRWAEDTRWWPMRQTPGGARLAGRARDLTRVYSLASLPCRCGRRSRRVSRRTRAREALVGGVVPSEVVAGWSALARTTGAVRAWTTDEAVPAAPRWQGDRTEAARVAEAIAGRWVAPRRG